MSSREEGETKWDLQVQRWQAMFFPSVGEEKRGSWDVRWCWSCDDAVQYYWHWLGASCHWWWWDCCEDPWSLCWKWSSEWFVRLFSILVRIRWLVQWHRDVDCSVLQDEINREDEKDRCVWSGRRWTYVAWLRRDLWSWLVGLQLRHNNRVVLVEDEGIRRSVAHDPVEDNAQRFYEGQRMSLSIIGDSLTRVLDFCCRLNRWFRARVSLFLRCILTWPDEHPRRKIVPQFDSCWDYHGH